MTDADQPGLYGVGVGPGDPGLITLRAAEVIRGADVVSYICSAPGRSQARTIAASLLDDNDRQQEELPFVMPMSENRDGANRVYGEAAAGIQARIDEGKRVVFLCEGDPLFFGSFAHLLPRLAHNHCEVVPGISSIHASAAALRRPLALLEESFAVASGRHGVERLVRVLEEHDSVVIMKAGVARPRILEALRQTGRIADAVYLEYVGRENQVIETDVTRLAQEPGPYFSLFVINRSNRGRT